MEKLNTPWVKYPLIIAVLATIYALAFPRRTVTEEEFIKREQELTSSFNKQLDEKQKEIDNIQKTSTLKVESLTSEIKTLKETSKQQLEKLTTENQSLKKSSEKVTIETRYPDGRIERKIVSRIVIDQESQKVTQIKKEMEKKIEETVSKLKQEKIDEIEKLNKQHVSEKEVISKELLVTKNTLNEEIKKRKEVEENKPHLGLGLGYRFNATKFVLAEYDIKGPIFIGTSLDIGYDTFKSASAILGVRF